MRDRRFDSKARDTRETVTVCLFLLGMGLVIWVALAAGEYAARYGIERALGQ